MAIVLAVLVVVRASYLLLPDLGSTYVNNGKIINFCVIPGIMSRDEDFGTFGSGTLGNIVVLCDNGEFRCKYVSLFT